MGSKGSTRVDAPDPFAVAEADALFNRIDQYTPLSQMVFYGPQRNQLVETLNPALQHTENQRLLSDIGLNNMALSRQADMKGGSLPSLTPHLQPGAQQEFFGLPTSLVAGTDPAITPPQVPDFIGQFQQPGGGGGVPGGGYGGFPSPGGTPPQGFPGGPALPSNGAGSTGDRLIGHTAQHLPGVLPKVLGFDKLFGGSEPRRGSLPGTEWVRGKNGKIVATGHGHWNPAMGQWVDRRGRPIKNQRPPPVGGTTVGRSYGKGIAQPATQLPGGPQGMGGLGGGFGGGSLPPPGGMTQQPGLMNGAMGGQQGFPSPQQGFPSPQQGQKGGKGGQQEGPPDGFAGPTSPGLADQMQNVQSTFNTTPGLGQAQTAQMGQPQMSTGLQAPLQLSPEQRAEISGGMRTGGINPQIGPNGERLSEMNRTAQGPQQMMSQAPQGAGGGLFGGTVGGLIDPSTFGQMGDLSQLEGMDLDRGRVEQAMFNRQSSLLQPQFDQEQQRLLSDLAARGIPRDSEAAQRELANFQRNKDETFSRLASDAVLAGGGEQSRLFGMSGALGDRRSQALSQMFGMGERLAERDILTQMQNANIAQTNRATQFNELASLLGLNQVAQPGLQNFFAPGQVDVGGAFALNQSAQQANAANATAQKTGMMDAIGGMAGAGITKSDRRLKKNIERIGTINGYPLYSFDYIWGEHSWGVMSDEVPAEFVTKGADGYDRVDYRRIF